MSRASEFEGWTRQVSAKYNSDTWQQETAELWQAQQEKMAANPLNIPGLHRDLESDLAKLEKRLAAWLENRREDFEHQRQVYAHYFNEMGISAPLRIPFDQQKPAFSIRLWRKRCSNSSRPR